jgi:outer membrane protein assembly factor BamD
VVVTEKDAETTEDAERSWFSILTFGVFDSTDEEEATPAQP